MKKLSFVILLSFMLLSTAFAQEANGFLADIPDLPDDPCSMTEEQQHEYNDHIIDLLKNLEEKISLKRKLIKQEAENSRDQIEKHMAQQYGLSNADLQKLKNNELSKTEKKAIADKMLQEKTGISMEEVEDLKKMSKEGKKAWAEGYTSQQMANMTPNADGSKSEEQIDMERELEKNKTMSDLLQEQKLLTDRIAASDKKFASRMFELEREDSIATAILKGQMRPLLKRLYEDEPGPTDKETIQIMKEIRMYEMNYCRILSPQLIGIYDESLISLKKFMPDFKRLEEITAEVNKNLTGINKDFSSPGLTELQAVDSYVHLLLNTFKYVKYSYSAYEETGE
jgi:hypothetical protein